MQNHLPLIKGKEIGVLTGLVVGYWRAPSGFAMQNHLPLNKGKEKVFNILLTYMRIHNKKIFEDRRRQLKGNMTDAEKVLWNKLRRKQLKGRRFRRQHGIGNFIVDFYCASEKLIIELDGEIHLDPEHMDADHKRSSTLEKYGYRVIRFHNREVFMNIGKVLDKIESSFQNRSGALPFPSPQ